MADAKIYRCKHCGNIVVKIVDGGPTPVCCGEPMEELVANTTDAAVEKHVPALTVEGDRLVAHVGSVEHPMTPEHYIEWLLFADGTKTVIRYLKPGEAPTHASTWARMARPRFTPTATSMASGRLSSRSNGPLNRATVRRAALAVPGRHASLWVVRASLAGIQSIAGYER